MRNVKEQELRTQLIHGKTIADSNEDAEDLEWDYSLEVGPSVSYHHGINVRCIIGHLESFVTFSPDGNVIVQYTGRRV